MPDNLRPKSSRFLYGLVVAGSLLIVALLSVPVLDGPHSRQVANEAAAVSKLRALTALEKKFEAAHIERSFACELPLLKPAETEHNPADYDPLTFLTTGASVGYKFVLSNCRSDDNGVVVHYEATAVPVERSRTGFLAFCTDESGLLWYDAQGSATNCLVSRRALQE